MGEKRDVRVGVVGAGLGGLMASIALSRAGAHTTLLESSPTLRELGAGIQMTPNVSRHLLRYGVAAHIGANLVQPRDIRMRRAADSKITQFTALHPQKTAEFGFPWWVVQRGHLHEGLVKCARDHGVQIVTGARVVGVDAGEKGGSVVVRTQGKGTREFDLVVGADGVNSSVRAQLFPGVKPVPLTTNAAYRAVIPYERVFAEVPEAPALFTESFDVWMGSGSYIIGYPISGGKELNLVLEHHCDHAVTEIEDVELEELYAHFRDYDPILQKVIRLVPEVKRWPLLQLNLNSWSSPQKNVVLMGDAAHAMVNHMAQGAATSMEDGVFLGRVMHDVVWGVLSMPEAVAIYEQGRMPRAWIKQQVSFAMGETYMFDEGRARGRDESSRASIPVGLRGYGDEAKESNALMGHVSRYTRAPRGTQQTRTNVVAEKDRVTGPDINQRSWNLWGALDTVPSVWTYDAEGHADFEVLRYLHHARGVDQHTKMAKGIEEKWTAWYLPEKERGKMAKARL